jgi:hypothetical protein
MCFLYYNREGHKKELMSEVCVVSVRREGMVIVSMDIRNYFPKMYQKFQALRVFDYGLVYVQHSPRLFVE